MAATLRQKLVDRVAIITGGASGIGEATARLFASEGARMVVIADVQDQLGQTVAKSISPTRCTYIHCDVTDETQVQSMVESTVQAHGKLDIMFSNAGIANPYQTMLDLELAQMKRLFAVNVTGTAACVKHAARAMVSCGARGSIVCTGSTAASVAQDGVEHDYCMSKHAVLGLVRSASAEFGKHGIRVNCVSPGAVATPMLMRALGFKDEETAEEAFSRHCALQGTVLRAEHVADAVLFLASEQSVCVTGHDLIVDAGMRFGGPQ